MAPRISVILPTRNRPDTLDRALTSLAGQDLPNAEIVVVNDGGAPVGDVLERHRSRLEIVGVDLPRETGPAAARNSALAVAKGDHLAFLDDDDVYLPGCLVSALDALGAGDADAVYCTTGVSSTWVDPGGPVPPRPAHAFDFPFLDRFLSVLNYVPPTGLVIRSDGGGAIRFDPELRAGEDWDLWLRLIRDHGYRFRHLDRLGAIYHRIPAHASAADPVAAGRRALGLFHAGYQRMCARWAVGDGSAEQAYRGLVLRVYELAFERYDAGRTLGAFWYERMVRLLYDGFAAGAPAADLRPRLNALLDPA